MVLLSKFRDNKINDITIDKKRIIDDIKKSDRIYIVAAGTSMHAGLLGKRYIERFSQIPVEVYVASEFAYELPIFSNKPVKMSI